MRRLHDKPGRGLLIATVLAVACALAFAGCKRDEVPRESLTDFPLAENPLESWTQYAANETHDTFIGGAIGELRYAGGLNEKPLFESFAKQSGGMAAADGKIFVPNDRGRMLAVDALSGDVVWADKANLASGRQFTSPTYHRGLVYCGTQPGDLICLDAKTGELVWNAGSESAMKGVKTCPAFMGSRVVFVDIESRVFCLDALSGVELWRFETSGAETAISDPVIAGDNAFFGTPAGSFYSVALGDGSVTFAQALSHSIECSPCVVGDRVYFTGIDGGVYVTSNAGELTKLFTMSGRSNAVPLVHNNRIVVSDDDNKVYCLNAETGELLWQVEVEGTPYGIAIGFDNAIVVFSSMNVAFDSLYLQLIKARGDLDDFIRRKGPFLAMTKADATEYESLGKKERESIGEPQPSPISDAELRELFSDGIKYLLAQHARLYVLSWDGRIVQESALPTALKASPILYDGKIYALDINGYIHVFEIETD